MQTKLLWCAVIVVAVIAVGMLTGCPKPPPPPANPPQTGMPPAPTPATAPSTPPAAGGSEYGQATPAATGEPQTAADPKHMTELEQKHVPQFAMAKEIMAGKPLAVTVNVGKIPHPMKPEHYIQWIELYLDGKLVKKIELKAGGKPMAKFEITPTAGPNTLKANIMCNIHGLWTNSMDITAK